MASAGERVGRLLPLPWRWNVLADMAGSAFHVRRVREPDSTVVTRYDLLHRGRLLAGLQAEELLAWLELLLGSARGVHCRSRGIPGEVEIWDEGLRCAVRREASGLLRVMRFPVSPPGDWDHRLMPDCMRNRLEGAHPETVRLRRNRERVDADSEALLRLVRWGQEERLWHGTSGWGAVSAAGDWALTWAAQPTESSHGLLMLEGRCEDVNMGHRLRLVGPMPGSVTHLRDVAALLHPAWRRGGSLERLRMPQRIGASGWRALVSGCVAILLHDGAEPVLVRTSELPDGMPRPWDDRSEGRLPAGMAGTPDPDREPEPEVSPVRRSIRLGGVE